MISCVFTTASHMCHIWSRSEKVDVKPACEPVAERGGGGGDDKGARRGDLFEVTGLHVLEMELEGERVMIRMKWIKIKECAYHALGDVNRTTIKRMRERERERQSDREREMRRNREQGAGRGEKRRGVHRGVVDWTGVEGGHGMRHHWGHVEAILVGPKESGLG